ncbi:hypothetical protein, partial [Cryobacterium sinapicolor]|uniref:hypothetical protein n=1 Tax=Cryobacterium sinapicolor TaxID=1259236 RepID=UPI001A7E1250
MVRSWLERRIARAEAERAILPISDTLLDEIGPIDLTEENHESEERWQVASELSGVTQCFRTVLLNSGLDRQMEHEKHKHFSPEFRAAAV